MARCLRSHPDRNRHPSRSRRQLTDSSSSTARGRATNSPATLITTADHDDRGAGREGVEFTQGGAQPADAHAQLVHVFVVALALRAAGVDGEILAWLHTVHTDFAAAVAATVVAAAELELDVAVAGYLCLAENMPGGNAQRPGDVVTMRNGSTVEIIDTDAEGRMVLADGMALAAESYPDQILDVATLTGACVVALGPQIFGVMGNDDEVRALLSPAADRPSTASVAPTAAKPSSASAWMPTPVSDTAITASSPSRRTGRGPPERACTAAPGRPARRSWRR